MRSFLRPAMYAAFALAGVKLANHLRPLDTASVKSTAVGGATGAWDALKRGDVTGAIGGLTSTGSAVAGNVESQVQATVVLGVVGGCVVAGVVDALVLS